MVCSRRTRSRDIFNRIRGIVLLWNIFYIKLCICGRTGGTVVAHEIAVTSRNFILRSMVRIRVGPRFWPPICFLFLGLAACTAFESFWE